MANNKDGSAKKIEKPLTKLNALFSDVVDRLAGGGNDRDKELSRINSEVDDIIFQEIRTLTKYTGDDISTFLVKLFNEYDTNNLNPIKGMEDIFGSEKSGMFSFFQERYRNQNLLYEDLNVICSQLYELKEALNTTRDSIVTADDISQTVSRQIKIKSGSDEDDDKKLMATRALVENMEEKFELKSKLKEHIIPNTLQYGKYYVYTVPYSELFKSHMMKKAKDQKLTKTLESVDLEFAKGFKESTVGKESTVRPDLIKNSFNEILENVEVCDDKDIFIPLLENADDISALMDTKFKDQVDKIQKEQAKESKDKKGISAFSDGTVDLKDSELDFSSIKDCYIKLIDPRKIIPITIMDQTIGYYYIHQTDVEVSRSPFTTSIKIGQNVNNKDLETQFLTKITDKIVKAFDKKYLEQNSKFKELILNSLIYNDIYKKQLKFQFIPVDYITTFAVNRDENGEGTSIVLPSLFYAKLYMALLIFKMITIISRSNDTKIYYVKNSGIDQGIANKVQEVARSIKERQINFMDLLSYPSMLNKIGQAKDIFMPVGRSGEKGIDFDILAGQDVQLNTDLMEMLRTAFINATGVPSVIMNYVNEADYAKTLVMANAKFLGRVVNHQMDFNKSTTELYRKILQFTTEIQVDRINEIEFALSPPKALTTTNMNDLISNATQVITFMITSMMGDNATATDDDNRLKDILYRKYAREIMPMLPWSQADVIYEEAKVELSKEKSERKLSGADQQA